MEDEATTRMDDGAEQLHHLLIVDDDRELCEILKRYLEAEDFLVSFVHTEDAGVKAGIEGSFELIVLDCHVAGQEGI